LHTENQLLPGSWLVLVSGRGLKTIRRKNKGFLSPPLVEPGLGWSRQGLTNNNKLSTYMGLWLQGEHVMQ
jgi:hypothetical protein